METMSMFATKEAMWEARAMRFARALADVMDGIKDHEIAEETGLPKEDCDRIAEARKDAMALMYGA